MMALHVAAPMMTRSRDNSKSWMSYAMNWELVIMAPTMTKFLMVMLRMKMNNWIGVWFLWMVSTSEG